MRIVVRLGLCGGEGSGCRGKLGEPKSRDEWMTSLPTKRAMKPAYMEQTSVNAFSSQGAQGAAEDASWTALPGQAPQLHIGYKGPMKKPQLAKDVIAEKNAELMRLSRQLQLKDQVSSLSIMCSEPYSVCKALSLKRAVAKRCVVRLQNSTCLTFIE